MKALTYIEHGKFVLTNKPKPVILDPRDALVRVTMASICTSDLHIKHGSVPRAVPGITVGHEMVGVGVGVGVGEGAAAGVGVGSAAGAAASPAQPVRESSSANTSSRQNNLLVFLSDISYSRKCLVFVDASADKFTDKRVGGHKALLYIAEKLQRRQHLAQLVKTLDALGNGAEKPGGNAVENRRLIGK